MKIRRALHRAGWRYRVNHAVVEGDRRRRADIAFVRLRVAVFVDGCFWHGCPEQVTSVKVVYGWAPSWAADIGSGGVG